MGLFSPPAERSNVDLSPLDQAYSAVEAIDAARHVDRVDSLKLGIAAKQSALAVAQERLQEIHKTIRDDRQPDGDTIAFALITNGEMPPVPEDLTREKEQLVAGINALSRQINDDHYPLRQPWNDLKVEIGDAVEPLIEELQRRAQEVIGQIEALYAASAALTRVTRTGRVDVLRRFSGSLLAEARESRRFFDFQAEVRVDPSLVAFNGLPAIKAMKYGMPDTVSPPSKLQMERDGL